MKNIENDVLRNEISKIRKYSDQHLLAETESLAKKERETTFLVLQRLEIIDRRKLFADLGFKSLWDYCCNKLKYSEDEAWRRISAMRLLRETPEAEAMIESGQISLTVLNLAGKHLRNVDAMKSTCAGTGSDENDKNDSSKMELLRELQNKSKKQAEEILADKLSKIDSSTGRDGSSQKVSQRKETTRPLGNDRFELRMTVDRKFLAKLEKLRGLLAHRKISAGPQNHAVDVFEWLIDQSIEKLDKGRQAPVGMSAKPLEPEQPNRSINRKRKYISVKITRDRWHRANSKCENCGSSWALQLEHVKPKALGGSDLPENLKLLCRNCNLRAAVRIFGCESLEGQREKVKREERRGS